MSVLESGNDSLLFKVENRYFALISAQNSVKPAIGEVEENGVEPEFEGKIFCLFVDVAEKIFVIGSGDANEVMNTLDHD